MSYFSQSFLNFFNELSKNNNSAWFNENRKTYEKEVKMPFASFVDLMIQRIKVYEPDINIKPADAIFRINNDIRFAKDKSPYKLHVGANISPFGKKDKTYPGFYFQLAHSGITIYGGTYMVEPPVLLKIRKAIAEDIDTFAKIYNDPVFVSKFGEIQGEKNKRITDEFLRQSAEKEPYIMNKQFYFMATLDQSNILSDELPELLMEYFQAGKPFNEFMSKAMN